MFPTYVLIIHHFIVEPTLVPLVTLYAVVSALTSVIKGLEIDFVGICSFLVVPCTSKDFEVDFVIFGTAGEPKFPVPDT